MKNRRKEFQKEARYAREVGKYIYSRTRKKLSVTEAAAHILE